jgi:hypothetical protein
MLSPGKIGDIAKAILVLSSWCSRRGREKQMQAPGNDESARNAAVI